MIIKKYTRTSGFALGDTFGDPSKTPVPNDAVRLDADALTSIQYGAYAERRQMMTE
ncbi:MAG: hypothetical protein LBN39_09430 [Planctomycetaceae bacterium]|nr:hypothetical protein [Planctomycetaceae bacterium]